MAIRIKTQSSEANDGTLNFLEAVLRQTGKKAMAGASRRMAIEADKIQERAIGQAPVDTGGVEDSIKIDKNFNDDRRIEFSIYIDDGVVAPDETPIRDYVLWLHEGSYELGEKSIAKSLTSHYKVGPKFLSRAADISRERVNESIFNAIKEVL